MGDRSCRSVGRLGRLLLQLRRTVAVLLLV